MEPSQRSECVATSAPLALVFGSDDAYAMALGVALHSALASLEPGTSVQVYVIDGGINEGNRAYIEQVGRFPRLNVALNWVRPDLARLMDLKTGGHVTTATYFSLLVPEIVPDHFDRAIYLDCDILVEASLLPLWRTPFHGKAMLAVRDFLIPFVSSPAGLVKYETLGIDRNSPYFNCGILVFNLKRWRREGIARKIFAYLRQYREFLNFRDQEGLNAILCNDCGLLDPKWNVQSSILFHEAWPQSDYKEALRPTLSDLIQNPRIVHFVGPNKPWHLDCRHPAKVSWFNHLGESKWFDALPGMPDFRDADSRDDSTNNELLSWGKVAVAILTSGADGNLEDCLKSVLSQAISDLSVLVLDDAPSPDKKAIVNSCADARIRYCPNVQPVGPFAHRRQALEGSRSAFLVILTDADQLPPGTLGTAIAAMERHPDAGFAACLTQPVQQPTDGKSAPPAESALYEVVGGERFLHHIAAGDDWHLDPATIVMRMSAIAAVRNDYAPHSKQPLDENLYLRIAGKFDVILIPGNSAQMCDGPKSFADGAAVQSSGATKVSPTIINDAIACLLRAPAARDDAYRGWLTQSLLASNKPNHFPVRALFPFLDASAGRRRQDVWDGIEAIVPAGQSLILVDEETRLKGELNGRTIWPFLERDGRFWGNPAADDDAILGLENLRRSGVFYLAVTDAAFWWFDHYAGFFRHLHSAYHCTLETDSLVIFDLNN